MTINRLAYNGDLNVYFHMKNHYRKLRNVKSTIDNSAPKGFRKTCPTPNNSPSSLETGNSEDRQSCLHVSRNNKNTPKLQNVQHSVGSQSETCVRSSSLPPRPITRRHPFEMPHRLQCKMRSQSVGPTSRKDVYIRLNNNKITKKRRNSRRKSKDQYKTITQSENKKDVNPESDETSKKNDGRKNRPLGQSKGKAMSRTEEQEYLQFLLRITEDIIINNYHTSEDVERVFQNHVQANKGHLKMGKMRAQLARLCGELNIPYNNNGMLFNKEDCYQNFFEPDLYNSSCHQNFDNCECLKIKALKLESRDQNKFPHRMHAGEQDNFNLMNDMMQDNFNISVSKHSLSRVTECTEPSNSLDTLMTSNKHPSGTTVSSLGNADVLPGLESINSKIDKELFEEVVGKILSREMTANKEPLTEKEKHSCVEEVSLFQKYDKLPVEFDKYTNSMNFVTIVKADKPLQSNIPKANEEEIAENSLKILDSILIGNETNHNKKESSEKVENINVQKPDKNTAVSAQKNNVPAIEIVDKIKTLETNALKLTYSKHTQMSACCADKQCNTSLKLNGLAKDDDYVLVNGPIYVLKTLLDSDEKLILYDNKPAIENDDEALVNDLARNTNFSRLLNSDYDLTPQREIDNGSAKYHHLSVDVSTSISNVNINKPLVSNLNRDSLLLTEGYALNGRKEFERYRPIENDVFFSGYVLPNDGQYEINTYSIPREIQESVGYCGCSNDSQSGNKNEFGRMTEQEVSLGRYEIYAPDSNFGENYSVVSEENSEMEDGRAKIKREEVNSQISFRSEMGQNSRKSPNLINILGKRKIKHS